MHPELTSVLYALQFIVGHSGDMPEDIFEVIGPIIAGLASATVLKNTVQLSEVKQSETKAVLQAHEQLTRQYPIDPSKLNPEGKIELFSKLVILNKEQLQALKGPCRQFILGASGTG